MSEQSAVEYLLDKYSEQRETVSGVILSGKLSPDEYKRLTGVLQGLEFAQNVVKDLAKRLIEEDAHG
jgi:hypothetical protein